MTEPRGGARKLRGRGLACDTDSIRIRYPRAEAARLKAWAKKLGVPKASLVRALCSMPVDGAELRRRLVADTVRRGRRHDTATTAILRAFIRAGTAELGMPTLIVALLKVRLDIDEAWGALTALRDDHTIELVAGPPVALEPHLAELCPPAGNGHVFVLARLRAARRRPS